MTGEPTGILKENAENLIKTGEFKTVRTPEEETERTWQGYLLAMKEAREFGVTSIQIPGSADFEAYEKLQKEGLLTSRIDIGEPLTGDTSASVKIYGSGKKISRKEGTGSDSDILKHLSMALSDQEQPLCLNHLPIIRNHQDLQ